MHWAAPGMLRGREGVTDGSVAILARWPDLRRPARARVATIAKSGQVSKARAERIRDAAREAVDFYDGFVDFDELAVELEVATAHLASLQRPRSPGSSSASASCTAASIPTICC